MNLPSSLVPAAALALVLSACGGPAPAPAPTPGPDPTPTISATQISGTFTGSTFPGGLAFLANDQRVSFTNEGTVTGPSTVNLTLAAAPESEDTFDLIPSAEYGCTFTGTSSSATPPRVSLWTSVLVASKTGDSLGTITETLTSGGSGPNSVVARLHSNQAATVAGTLACPDSAFSVVLDLKLTAGWNALEYTFTPTSLSLKTLPATAKSALVAKGFTPSVVAVIEPTTLTFDTNATATARATFIQVGGYSGTISLSTDLSGLTVEPATVTLPTLSAQATRAAVPTGLRALMSRQSVDTTLTFKYTGTTNGYQPFTLNVRDSAGQLLTTVPGSLQVNRPGLSIYTSYIPPLAAGATVKAPVCASPTGNFSGEVTFSAKDLPAGVTVTPVKATVRDYICVEVPLTASSSVKSGTATITMTAVSGTASAQTQSALTTAGPSVTLSFVSYTTPVYQGGTGTATVDVTGQNGFNGTTTLTLTGLPAGVTADPKTVTVTAGATTRASLTLRATASATLGNTTVTVTSPDQNPNATYNTTTTLSVRPSRVEITSGAEPVAATSGIWQITSPSFDGSTVALTSPSGAVTSRTVANYVDRLIGTQGGVLAISQGTQTGSLIKNDGTVSDLPSIKIYSSDATTTRTDAQGRVWFVRSAYNGSISTASLQTWVPTTGVVKTIDTTNIPANESPVLTLSPDGQYVVVAFASSGKLLRYRADTAEVTSFTVGSSFSTAAISNAGTIWTTTYYSGLARLNEDVTSTIFNVNTGALVGFDATQPDILWGLDYSNVYRIDTAKGTSTTINFGDSWGTRAVPALSSGLNVVVPEYQNTGGTKTYLSIVK